MDVSFIEDRIAWGHNLAARRLGSLVDAYRPNGLHEPLAASNRYLRLHAAFSPSPGNFEQAPGYGNAIYFGYFDSAYTKPGDYLVQGERTFFIATQESLLPVLCVRANRILTIRRPDAPAAAGTNGYGGVVSSATSLVAARWPASMMGMATGGSAVSGLPTDTATPQWTVLMPASNTAAILPADLVIDDDGRQSVVISAERSHMGVRLITRQATT